MVVALILILSSRCGTNPKGQENPSAAINISKRTVTASTFLSEICHPILFGQSKRISVDDGTRSTKN
jgi:hypothetical protein